MIDLQQMSFELSSSHDRDILDLMNGSTISDDSKFVGGLHLMIIL